MTIARYRLANRASGPLVIAAFVFMAVVGGTFLLNTVDRRDPYRAVFMVVWCSFLVFGAYRQCTAAREIIVHENDDIEFVSWASSIQMAARDIQSIKATFGSRSSQVVVRHSAGRIYLAGSFDRFHQFLSELEQANPAVQISGL